MGNYIVIVLCCILCQIDNMQCTSPACVSTYERQYVFTIMPPSCKDCSQKGKFNCEVTKYYGNYPIHGRGTHMSYLTGVDWCNATLEITFVIPPTATKVVMNFKSIENTEYTDDYYAFHEVNRVFDVWNNTYDVYKSEKLAHFSCIYGLDTCSNPSKSNIRVYRIILTAYPMNTSYIHFISSYNNRTHLGWKSTICVAPLMTGSGIRVIFAPKKAGLYRQYIVSLLKMDSDSVLDVKDHQTRYLIYRDGRHNCSFENVPDGKYKIKVVLENYDGNIHSKTESAVFSFRNGVITINTKINNAKVEDTETPPTWFIIIGVIAGIVLVMVLIVIRWKTQKDADPEQIVRGNHVTIPLLPNSPDSNGNILQDTGITSEVRSDTSLVTTRAETEETSPMDSGFQSCSLSYTERNCRMDKEYQHHPELSEEKGNNSVNSMDEHCYAYTASDSSITEHLKYFNRLEEDCNAHYERDYLKKRRIPLNLSCYCRYCNVTVHENVSQETNGQVNEYNIYTTDAHGIPKEYQERGKGSCLQNMKDKVIHGSNDDECNEDVDNRVSSSYYQQSETWGTNCDKPNHGIDCHAMKSISSDINGVRQENIPNSCPVHSKYKM